MQVGKHMANQLDCTISIASTQNNGIHGIHIGQHTTFNRINPSASTRKRGSINISGMDWTTSNSKHSNLRMPCESSSLNLILGSAMIIGLKIIHISSEHYNTRIFSNVFSSFLNISHCRGTLILNWCGSPTRKTAEYPV